MDGRFGWVALALVAGCGLPGGKALVDLEDEDWIALCEEVEPESFTCREATDLIVTYEFGSEDCEADFAQIQPALSDDCEATVDDWRDCTNAQLELLRQDPCADEPPPECAFFETCAPATR